MGNKTTASTLLTCAGSLMLISGVLIGVSMSIAVAGILWAAAACMFFAAYHFKLAEREQEKKDQEDSNHEEDTL